jgi:hypothetical protein
MIWDVHPGSRIQVSKKHRIPDPQHCEYLVEVEIVLE